MVSEVWQSLININRMNEFLKLRQGNFQRRPHSDRERRQATKSPETNNNYYNKRDHEMAVRNSKHINVKECMLNQFKS